MIGRTIPGSVPISAELTTAPGFKASLIFAATSAIGAIRNRVTFKNAFGTLVGTTNIKTLLGRIVKLTATAVTLVTRNRRITKIRLALGSFIAKSIRANAKSYFATVSSVSSYKRTVSKTKLVSFIAATTRIRQMTKSFIGGSIVSSSYAYARVFNLFFNAAVATSSNFVRYVKRMRTVTVSASPTRIRRINRISAVSLVISSASTFVRMMRRAMSTTLNVLPGITFIKIFQMFLSATINVAGTTSRLVRKSMSVTLDMVESRARKIAKRLSANRSVSSVRQRQVTKNAGGFLTVVTTLVKRLVKIFSYSLHLASSRSRVVKKFFSKIIPILAIRQFFRLKQFFATVGVTSTRSRLVNKYSTAQTLLNSTYRRYMSIQVFSSLTAKAKSIIQGLKSQIDIRIVPVNNTKIIVDTIARPLKTIVNLSNKIKKIVVK